MNNLDRFKKVIDKFYDGNKDEITLNMLNR